MSLLRKTFVLGLGSGAARLLGAAILVLLARLLGVARFGIFGYAMSVALLLEVVIDMGQTVHVGRVVAHDPAEGPGSFGELAATKVVLTTVFALGAFAVIRLSGASAEEALTVALMVVWGGFLSLLDSERAIARSLDRFGADSWVNSLESVGRLLGVGAAGALGLGLAGFGAAFAIECGVAAVAFYFVLARHARLLRRPSLAASLRFVRASVPLGLAGVAFVGFYQIDQVFVRALAGAEANGLYGAAARIVFAANSLAALVVMAGYPELARLREDPAAFRQRFGTILGLACAGGAAVSLVAFAAAGPIVRVLYGSAYAGTVPLLRVLAPVVLLDALVISCVYAGNALGRERKTLLVIGLLFAGNALANWLLVPLFGAFAAAWVSVAGEAILAIGLLGVVWDRVASVAPLPEAVRADS